MLKTVLHYIVRIHENVLLLFCAYRLIYLKSIAYVLEEDIAHKVIHISCAKLRCYKYYFLMLFTAVHAL